MRNFKFGWLLFAALSAVGLASCSDDAPWEGSDSEGGIKLNLSADARVMRSNNTRADDSMSPEVPDASAFAVNLSKVDGSYSKNWSSLEAFNRESGFSIGDYNLTASYGSLDAEGFTAPYYKGSTSLHVSPGAESNVDVVATLANSMVSLRYTPDFVENYPAYSAALQSEGHDWVVFAQNEDRPAYMAPSDIKINLTLTNAGGDKVTIQPAEFTALPRHHYVVTIGVTGTSGNLALDVQFEENVVAETVIVPLGDDLFTAPAPTVKTTGFQPDNAITSFEYAQSAETLKFDVFSLGGLKSATLNIVADNGYVPVFGKNVELIKADALVQQQLAAAGINAAGFFRNPDKMGVVDVTRFVEKLPAGNYKIELQVVDALTRTTPPVALALNIEGVEFEPSAPQAAEFMTSSFYVDVATNSADIKNQVSFRVPDANNQMKAATIKSVTEVTATRANLNKVFRYTLDIAPQARASIDVEVILGDKKKSFAVPMSTPECGFVADAFSRSVVMKVNVTPANLLSQVEEQMVFYNGTQQISASNVKRDSNGVVTISGLSPATSYSALSAHVGTLVYNLPAFTTEAETDVPNGTFSSTSQTINISGVQVGGQYNVTANYTIKSSIVAEEPTGWASVNQNTCWTGSSNINTWFLVPSTYISNGTTVLRSVGYNHAGTTPAKSGGAFNTKYYCENAPTNAQLEKAAGELFLGSYTFNGSSSRVDGIAFASRPSSLSFSYAYAPLNGEQAEVVIKLIDASGNVISEKTDLLSAASSLTGHTVALPAYPFGAKAAKLVLGFRSTRSGVTPSINIPSGSALNEGQGLGNKTIGANTYHALAVGSVLTLDNVQLGYGSPSVSLSKKAKLPAGKNSRAKRR